MNRYHRRARRDPINKPAPHGFNAAELIAWLDAVCALRIFRVDAGQGGAPGLEAPRRVAGALRS